MKKKLYKFEELLELQTFDTFMLMSSYGLIMYFHNVQDAIV